MYGSQGEGISIEKSKRKPSVRSHLKCTLFLGHTQALAQADWHMYLAEVGHTRGSIFFSNL